MSEFVRRFALLCNETNDFDRGFALLCNENRDFERGSAHFLIEISGVVRGVGLLISEIDVASSSEAGYFLLYARAISSTNYTIDVCVRCHRDSLRIRT